MGRTVVQYTCFKILNISQPSSAKQQREITKTGKVWELKPRQQII